MTTTDLHAENGADKICEVYNLRVEKGYRNPNGTNTPTYFFFECAVELTSLGKYCLNIKDSPVKIQVVGQDMNVVQAMGL